MEDLEPARPRRFADDDLGDVVGAREGEDVVGDPSRAARNGHRLAAERFGEPQRVGDAVARLRRELQRPRRLDAERRPGRVQPVGQALGVAHEAGGARILADADQNPLARRPRARDGVRLHLGEQLVVDALGGPAQRELAQRRQVARREEVLERPLGLLRDVDLAFLQPLDQVVGRQVDELDRVGPVEDGIGHRLAHADAGDLRDDVVQALDVLDVERRVDVDAAVEQLLDIEIALGVAAAGRVGVGEFVDQRDLRAARDDGVEVHLLERAALVLDALARHDLEPLEQGLGLLAPMGLDDADDDIVAVFRLGAGGLQHLVGLADAGRGADEDLQPAGTSFLAPGRFEQRFGRGSLVEVAR